MLNKILGIVSLIAIVIALFLGTRGCVFEKELQLKKASYQQLVKTVDSISKLPPKIKIEYVDKVVTVAPKIIRVGIDAKELKHLIDSLKQINSNADIYSYYADTISDTTGGAVWYEITTAGNLETIQLGYRCREITIEKLTPVFLPCPDIVTPKNTLQIWGEVVGFKSGMGAGVIMSKGSWGGTVKYRTPDIIEGGIVYRFR